MPTASAIVELLDLQPHPEGGFFREIYRSSQPVFPGSALRDGQAGPLGDRRCALTSIYFLLEAGDFSAFHRVTSDEVWHLVAGGPLDLHVLDECGLHRRDQLSLIWEAGWGPQAVVRGGEWQAARPAAEAPWALCTCLVAPGFEFADFTMPTRAELLSLFPHQGPLIQELTRR
jgi:predicted cupin superfamily sugar epimerase